jgi:hypothetical protein
MLINTITVIVTLVISVDIPTTLAPRVILHEWGSCSPSERFGWQQCEIFSLTLREKHRLRVFEKYGAEADIWTKEGRVNRRVENYFTISFIICTPNQILF